MKLLLVIAIILGSVGALASPLLLFRLRWSRAGPIVWMLKSYVTALSFYLGIGGAIACVIGMAIHSAVATVLGAYCAAVYFTYLARLKFARCVISFKEPLASSLEKEATDRKHAGKHGEGFIFKQNIPFATIPGTERQLLCDLWLPSSDVLQSGLAYIYLHGSEWYALDKDFGTRSYFRHLVSQGHVVMDVAYRVFPEADMTGMIQDAKRAINWMKVNAREYNIDPGRIVIGGGSAGGHLALMAAYSPDEKRLTPPELNGSDISVRAVVSVYGVPDLAALYYHTDQQITTTAADKDKADGGAMPAWIQKMMGKEYVRLGFNKPSRDAGALGVILGCHPDKCPDVYEYFSPLHHVSKDCPPSLLLHGTHDSISPVAGTYRLYEKLSAAGVPVMMHILPQNDHGFDLFMPDVSPAARIALKDTEGFLNAVNKKAHQ